MLDKNATVIINPNLFRHNELLMAVVPEGYTITQLVGENPFSGIQVMINSDIIPPGEWNTYKIKISDQIQIAVFPEGGNGNGAKNIFRIVAMIAVIVIANVYGGPFGNNVLGIAEKVGEGVGIGVLSLAGGLMVNALIPPQMPSQPKAMEQPAQSYSITTGRNAYRHYGTVPKVYGFCRYSPVFGANNYTEIRGNDQYLNMLFCLGYGPLTISDIQIGDTAIENFEEAAYEIGNIDEITLYKNDVEENSEFIALAPEEIYVDGVLQTPSDDEKPDIVSSVTREFQNDTNTHQISIDFSFSQGLRSLDQQANEGWATVEIEIQSKNLQTSIEVEFNNLFRAGSSKGFVLDCGRNFSNEECGDNFIKSAGGGHEIFKGGAWTPIDQDTELNNMALALFSAYQHHGLSSSHIPVFICNYDLEKRYLQAGEISWSDWDGKKLTVDSYLCDHFSNLGSVLHLDIYKSVTINKSSLYKHGAIWFNLQTGKIKYWNSSEEKFIELESYTYKTGYGWGEVARREWKYSQKDPVRKNITFNIETDTNKAEFKIINKRRDSQYSEYVFADFGISAIRLVKNRQPVIDPKHKFLFLAMQIKATNQLNGSVDNVSVFGKSILPVWDGSQFTNKETNNPAWIYADILRGSQVASPVPDELIDFEKLLEWGGICSDNNLGYNNVHDGELLLLEYLNMVATTGRAQWTLTDNLFSVILDTLQSIPRQMISPRNSWGFSASKTFIKIPHGVKVKYINPESWEQDVVIAYDDGFDKNNATEFEELVTIGVTNSDQAWKEGRYHLAAAKLRPEIYTVNMDFENLVARRGDLVILANDVMLVGLGSGRVKEVRSARQFLIDEEFIFTPGKSYVLRIRHNDNTQTLTPITNSPGAAKLIKVASDIANVNPGDLVIYGESEKECIDAKIKSIEYHTDLSATLKLVDAAPAINDADTGIIPDYDPKITQPIDSALILPTVPIINEIVGNISNVPGGIRKKIFINFSLLSNRVPIKTVKMRCKIDGGEWTYFETPAWKGSFFIDADHLEGGEIVTAQIKGVSTADVEGRWSISKTIELDFSLPSSNPNTGSPIIGVIGIEVEKNAYGYAFSWDFSGVLPGQIGYYDLFLDNEPLISGLKETHYNCQKAIGSGSHKLIIKIYDNKGKQLAQSEKLFDVEYLMVKNLNVTQDAWGYSLEWDKVAETIQGYNLYVNDILINEKYQGTTFSYVRNLSDGDHVFKVRVVDKYGYEQPLESELGFTLDPDREVNLNNVNVTYRLDASTGKITINWAPVEGSNAPQVKYYEIRGARKEAAIWNQARTVYRTRQTTATFSIDPSKMEKLFIRPRLTYTNEFGHSYSAWSLVWVEFSLLILPEPKLNISVEEPNIVVKWQPITGAVRYEVLKRRFNIGERAVVTDPRYTFPILNYLTFVQVRAWSDKGFSRWSMREEVKKIGNYNWNEILNLDFKFINGKFVNFCWTSEQEVYRPSILGTNLDLPITNINDSDLYNLAGKFGNIPVEKIVNIPANWFRDSWWKNSQGYFESDIIDLGEKYSGRLIGGLDQKIISHPKTPKSFENIQARHLEDFTADDLMSNDAVLTAEFYASEDGESWIQVPNETWISNVRYFVIRGSVMYANPLDEIYVKTGKIILDVPDMTETGKISVTDGKAYVEFTKKFHTCNTVIATAEGDAYAYVRNVTNKGFDVQTGNYDEPIVISWWAKGY